MDILTDIMGMQVTYREWDGKKKLPFYLASGYYFQEADIDGCKCMVIYPQDGLPTLPALKKQILRIQEIAPVPVVLRVETMSAFRRKSMIENKIPFIVEEKQVYLPFMGTLLQAKADIPAKELDKFMVSSQLLFLLFIYRNGTELHLSEASRELPYSAMTITRAARQLEGSGLFYVKKSGVNKILTCRCSKKELYGQAKKYLSSPVLMTGYIPKEKLTEKMVLAGVSALAERSMLNAGILTDYAVYQKDIDKKILAGELVSPYEQAFVQVWRYAPDLFAKDGIADPVSIALSLADEADERVEGEIDEMLGELWGNMDGKGI